MINLLQNSTLNINDLLKICLEKNLSFVSYSLPKSKHVTTLVQYNSLPRVIHNFSNIQKLKGFVIAPFNIKGEFPAYILEPDKIITTCYVPDDMLMQLKALNTSVSSTNVPGIYSSTEKSDFIQQVSSIKKEIDKGVYNKVVLSRILVDSRVKNIDPTSIFDTIRIKYPLTFRYIINIPDIGCWMGASPEPFIINRSNSYEITALAGTQKLNGVPLQNLNWGIKELTEQQYVTLHIANVLQKYNITDYSLHGPFSYRASNVAHLKSVFQLTTESLKFYLGEFIEELHPSPSVAGMPKMDAINFINRLEQHKREYYTGFLGPINMNNQTNLFVNLRCMKITNGTSLLYAGAGITKGSDAEMEWEETDQKLYAMQSVLNEKTTI